MKVLVLNCGSSSLKYQFIDMTNESVIAKGLCERIGIANSKLVHEVNGEKHVFEIDQPNHNVSVQLVLEKLTDATVGVIKSLDEIAACGHRVVHGGELFTKSAIITDEVKAAIAKCADLAPLHNPANLIGIEAITKLLPNLKQTAVFDTAFHQTMEKSAFLYAIPYEYYEKYGVRRYGFHGTSHMYVSDRAADMLGKDKKDLKIITCHLGNGASVCAIKGGKVVDTSMGLTPLEGLIMGTRCGDIDPAVIKFIADKEGKTIAQIDNMLNKESGVFGISGVSSDFRDLEDAEATNERAKIALEMYHAHVAKYIGAYAAEMNGVDVIVFTAGLGENGIDSRSKICSYLTYLGVSVDEEANKVRGKERDFSKADAKVKTLVVPTNEELVIARDTVALLK